MRPPRRRLLTAAAGSVAALTALAGCSGGGDGDGETTTGDDTTTTGGGPGTTTGDGTTADGSTTAGTTSSAPTTSTAGTTDGSGGETTASTTTTTLKESYSPPETEFGFVYDAEANTLLIANTGVGEFTAANTARLSIRVDGEAATDWELPVEGGDQTSVEADPGATVELLWISPIDEREVVGTYEVPTS